MTLILKNILVMVVVNRVTSKPSALIMRARKKNDFKSERRGKSKKAYIAWDDNDISSSSSSEDEETNLC